MSSFSSMRDSFTSGLDRWNAFDNRLQGSSLGRAARAGTMEAFGFHFERGTGPLGDFTAGKGFGNRAGPLKNMGFMGLRDSLPAFRNQAIGFQPAPRGAPSSFSRAMISQPKTVLKASAGLAGKTAWRSMSLLGTLHLAYSGYKEEGVWGAAKGLGESALWSAGFRMAGVVAGGVIGTLAIGVTAAAAVGYAGYSIGERGRAHAKQLRQVEMGGGTKVMEALSSHGAATMRQRAVMALNNTHLNGRSAMGSEASLMHTPYL